MELWFACGEVAVEKEAVCGEAGDERSRLGRKVGRGSYGFLYWPAVGGQWPLDRCTVAFGVGGLCLVGLSVNLGGMLGGS